jgi:hypothetical protein
MRARGIAFDGVEILYEGPDATDPTAEDVVDFAGDMADPGDPDRNFPVVPATRLQLEAAFRYDGMHPGHCLLDANREIVWCAHGHGLEDVVRDTIVAFAE